jgi:hypothetical protein
MWKRSISALTALGLVVLAGAAVYLGRTQPVPVTADLHPVWTEVKWSFPIDQWGTGKAFHCIAKDCGTEVDIYLRPKIGFCNCTTGVADDEELERVADLGLFGDRQRALAPGRPITVRWMKGRSRPYSVSSLLAKENPTLTIAFNDRCDVIVATVVAGHNRPAELESVALEFLNGDTVIRWVEAALGL